MASQVILLIFLVISQSKAAKIKLGEREVDNDSLTIGSSCVAEYDWCYHDEECCDGFACDFPPEIDEFEASEEAFQATSGNCLQAGVCRSVREGLCALKWEHCDVLPCCNNIPCTCAGDWVVECGCY